ncbi:MAG: hypothetical protein HYR63_10200 [Proteobacteria bacterium]|nr:hypothetical protein [Pseudomonadota bacterium]MBI3499761.1 hypothetical protein [Pseudomonadota bacterium]
MRRTIPLAVLLAATMTPPSLAQQVDEAGVLLAIDATFSMASRELGRARTASAGLGAR